MSICIRARTATTNVPSRKGTSEEPAVDASTDNESNNDMDSEIAELRDEADTSCVIPDSINEGQPTSVPKSKPSKGGKNKINKNDSEEWKVIMEMRDDIREKKELKKQQNNDPENSSV